MWNQWTQILLILTTLNNRIFSKAINKCTHSKLNYWTFPHLNFHNIVLDKKITLLKFNSQVLAYHRPILNANVKAVPSGIIGTRHKRLKLWLITEKLLHVFHWSIGLIHKSWWIYRTKTTIFNFITLNFRPQFRTSWLWILDILNKFMNWNSKQPTDNSILIDLWLN